MSGATTADEYLRVEEQRSLEAMRRMRVEDTMDVIRDRFGHPFEPAPEVEWPAIVPLAPDSGPPLRLDFMPGVLAEVVEVVVSSYNVPVELAWGVGVGVIATAIGRRAVVQLPTHVEPSPLWVCTVLPPGCRKSAVLRELSKPLLTQERILRTEWKTNYATWKAKAAVAEERVRALKREAAKVSNDDQGMLNAIAAAQSLLDTAPPKPTLWTSDTTPEALRRLLEENGSLGIISAEGASLLDCFGRYTGGERGADLAIFLAAHAGDADRGSRVSGEHGTSQALASVAITVQPDVLASARIDILKRTRGLLDRFLWLVPEDPRGTRDYSKHEPLSDAVIERWESAVARIFELPAAKPGEDIPIVKLDDAASALWLDFAQAIEDRQAADGDLRAVSGWASKLAGAVGRTALSYHVVQGNGTDEAINEATITVAVGIGLQLVDHAKVALSELDDATRRARLTLACIRKHEPNLLTPRDVAVNGWGGCRDVETARAVLLLLNAHHVCREVERVRQGETGAQPKDCYELNPAVWAER